MLHAKNKSMLSYTMKKNLNWMVYIWYSVSNLTELWIVPNLRVHPVVILQYLVPQWSQKIDNAETA